MAAKKKLDPMLVHELTKKKAKKKSSAGRASGGRATSSRELELRLLAHQLGLKRKDLRGQGVVKHVKQRDAGLDYEEADFVDPTTGRKKVMVGPHLSYGPKPCPKCGEWHDRGSHKSHGLGADARVHGK